METRYTDDFYKVEKIKVEDAKDFIKFETSDVWKSGKYYPVFELPDGEYIFKPMHLHKPNLTGLFPIAEVFWGAFAESIKYPNAKYKLAVCEGINKQNFIYDDYGCLSKNILGKDEKLVPVYDYLCNNENVSDEFRNYINYAGVAYDYMPVLESKLLQGRPDLAERLAEKIIWSIYIANLNLHYSNCLMVADKAGNIKRFAECFDNEYSGFFGGEVNASREVHKTIINSDIIKKEVKYLREQFPSAVNKLEDKILNFSKSDDFKKLFDFSSAADFWANTVKQPTKPGRDWQEGMYLTKLISGKKTEQEIKKRDMKRFYAEIYPSDVPRETAETIFYNSNTFALSGLREGGKKPADMKKFSKHAYKDISGHFEDVYTL